MRKHYIDNLRCSAVLLLIPYHAAMAFNTWGEPNYIQLKENSLISSLVVFLSPFYMPLLFVLAGISTKYALQKRTLRQYLAQRAHRLLLPLIPGLFLFMPCMAYMADRYQCGFQGSLLSHYQIFFTKFTDLTGADGGFSFGQFWFILYLFVISAVSFGIIRLQQLTLPIPIGRRMPVWLFCLLGLPLPFLNGLLSIGGKSLAEYLYLFLAGFYVLSSEQVSCQLAEYRLFFLCTGLSASFLNTWLFLRADFYSPALQTAARSVSEWFMLAALAGIGHAWLDFNTKLSRFLSQNSYLFYILHYIWTVFFQYLISGIFSENIFLLYSVPVCLAYCATFLSCSICTALMDFGRLLCKAYWPPG